MTLARRADHSRDDLTEIALATATRIIETEGLQSLTTRKVAAEIGYSPGTIYNLFEDFDALISRVNIRTMQKFNASLGKVQLSGDAISDAKEILQVYLDFISMNPSLWASNITHGSREDIQQPAEFLQELDKAFQKVEAAIAPLFDADSKREAWISARVLWASLQGIVSMPANARIISEKSMTTKEMAENLVDKYLRGI